MPFTNANSIHAPHAVNAGHARLLAAMRVGARWESRTGNAGRRRVVRIERIEGVRVFLHTLRAGVCPQSKKHARDYSMEAAILMRAFRPV